ncbi:MAG TPA: hypothetical protein VJ302_09330 [Blastocatellia bacterium]|nr:hypothetical protein [Blastocatellia bacterium]
MPLNENHRFIVLTLGVFCLTLGTAVLLFSLIERVFFAVRFIGWFMELSSIAILFGAILLRYGWRKREI